MRVVRFQSRNPVVVVLILVLVLALLATLLTAGLVVGGALAVVGGAGLLARRVFGGHRLPRSEPQRLDRAREVFGPVSGRTLAVFPRESVFRWRRLDVAGRELAHVERHDDGWLITGDVSVTELGIESQLHYAIACDARWRTRSAIIDHASDAGQGRIVLDADGEGHWTVDGVPHPALDGALDIDLGFTPMTNTLPIRRLMLDVGESQAVVSAWLRFPELRLETLEQTYTREDETTYRYRSMLDGAEFAARLETDRFGRVLEYEGLWIAEPSEAVK